MAFLFTIRRDISDTSKARIDTKNQHYNVLICHIDLTRLIFVAFENLKTKTGKTLEIKFEEALQLRIVCS